MSFPMYPDTVHPAMDPNFKYGIQEHGFHSDEADSKAFHRATPNHGDGLFTRMDIKVGDEVLQIRKPLVAVLDSARLEDTCANCFGARTANNLADEKVKLKRCTGCQKVKYCDKTCQAKNWSFGHKYECPIFKRVPIKKLPSNARAILQILLRHEHGKIRDGLMRQFLSLSNHHVSITKDRPLRRMGIVQASDVVAVYCGIPIEKDQLESMFSRLDTNCFTLTNSSADRIGLFLDVTFASFMNHSCQYNTVVGFDGTVMYAKAVRAIKPDEEILISYVDATNPYEQRQQELDERYFFKCDCPKCFKGRDTRENRFLAPLSDVKIDVETIERKVKDLTTYSEDESPEKTANVFKSAMKMLSDTFIWPITRQPYATLRDELIASLLEAQKFQEAFIQATIRYLRVDPVLWPKEYHPTRHMHNWVLAKLAIHISQGVDTTHDTVDLQPYEINFGLLVWMLLNKLAGKNGSCSVPSFQKMIESKYDEVCTEFAAHGLNPVDMKGEIKSEWEKMERVADDVLKMDGVVEAS